VREANCTLLEVAMQRSEENELAEIQLLRREVKRLQHSIDMLEERVKGFHDMEMLHIENQRLKIELKLSQFEKRLPPPTK
jgi:hypothetical protein